MIALATTRLRAFWPDGDAPVLLGRWCVPADDLWTPRETSYRIAPYPWDDRARFLAAAREIDGLGERLLPPLAAALDRHHGLSGGTRYWRVIVGPWLAWYLEALCDRYTCVHDVLTASGGASAIRTVGLDPADFVVPATMADFSRLYVDDPYNLQWYTRVLEKLGVVMPRRRLPPEMTMAAALGPRRDLRAWVRRLQAWRIRRSTALMVGASMNGAEHRAWSGRTAGRIGGMLEMPEIDGRATVSTEARARLKAELPDGEGLAGLAATMVAEDLPTAYLEAFRPAAGPLPRLLVSGTGWAADERFKRLSAAALGQGARLVAVQHGGYYGMLAAHSPECHEQRVADAYVTAGWTDPLVPGVKTVPLPMPSIGCGPRPGSRGDILFVTTMHPRYLYRLQSHPVGSQWADYLRDAIAFVGALAPAVRARLRVRLYPFDYGWEMARAWRVAHPDVDARPGNGDMASAMAHADVVVIDHPATSLLEAAARDLPHVLFWNPARFEMRPSAVAACAALRVAGILSDTPEAAADILNDAVRDPDGWWHDARRQQAARAFRERYARADPEWRSIWQTHLLNELEGTKGLAGLDEDREEMAQ